MNCIYEPKGKAREYSPLALNLYTGCSNGCKYCYAPGIRRMNRPDYLNVTLRKDIIQELKKQLDKQLIKEQVLLCFMCDPYCKENIKLKLTRQALELLLMYKVPVSILTKNGLNALNDLDIIKQFGNNIKIGTTLTFDNAKDSKEYEPNAALPKERLKMLLKLKEAGVRTWASLEPVIKPEQSINLIEKTINYVDEYKIGKLNNWQGLDKQVNWNEFLKSVIKILRNNKKDFYIKEDLRNYSNGLKLYGNECMMDEWNLKWSVVNKGI